MPVAISQSFQLNASTPLDARMVSNGSASRDQIENKYVGLRIYDLNDKKGYVWMGTEWKEDGKTETVVVNPNSNSNPAGEPGYAVKFRSGGLTQSAIRDEYKGGDLYYVGVNKPSTLTAQLDVGGKLGASAFVGIMDGKYIGNSTLNLSSIVTRPGGDYVLKCVNGTSQWVAYSTSATAISITKSTSNSGLVTFVKSADDEAEFLVNSINASRGIKLTPSMGQIEVSCDAANGEAAPGYSFVAQEDSGLYHDTLVMGLALQGRPRLVVDSLNVDIKQNLPAPSDSVAVFADFEVRTTVETTVDGMLWATDSFKLNTNESVNDFVLTAISADGVGVWRKKPADIGIPFGTIIMWAYGDSVPEGFMVCQGIGSIHTNGSYQPVPDLRDRNISGSADMSSRGTYGSVSAKQSNSMTLSVGNIPRHKHAVSTSNYPNDKIGPSEKVTVSGSFVGDEVETGVVRLDDNVNAQNHSHAYKMDGDGSTGSSWGQAGSLSCVEICVFWVCATNCPSDHSGALYPAGDHEHKFTMKGLVTPYLNGYTDDGSTRHSSLGQPFAMPHVKVYELIFIIKYDPEAKPDQPGHFRPY